MLWGGCLQIQGSSDTSAMVSASYSTDEIQHQPISLKAFLLREIGCLTQPCQPGGAGTEGREAGKALGLDTGASIGTPQDFN